MQKALQRLMLTLVAALLLDGCARVDKPEVVAGQWIRFNEATQRYSIEAQQVLRGALLDELKVVAGADVRPQPERETLITVRAKDLDLDGLVALLLPTGTRFTVRPGAREIVAAVPKAVRMKQGVSLQPAESAMAKPDPARDAVSELKRGGTLKAAPEASYPSHERTGLGTKPQANILLHPAQTVGPKQAMVSHPAFDTIRLQLQFEDGQAPRLIDVRAIEGRVQAQRFVTGSYLYAITAADGRVLDMGTLQDPLIEHSYLPEGQHSVGRARSGIAGISVARENLMKGADLRIVDLTGISIPRELDEHMFRVTVERGKSVLQLKTANILRRIEKEAE